jgi:hypothetical protein
MTNLLCGNCGVWEYWMIYRGPGFSRTYNLVPRLLPLPPTLSRQARPATHRKTEKERQLAHWRGGGAESYNRMKVWSSIIIQYSLLRRIHLLRLCSLIFRFSHQQYGLVIRKFYPKVLFTHEFYQYCAVWKKLQKWKGTCTSENKAKYISKSSFYKLHALIQ